MNSQKVVYIMMKLIRTSICHSIVAGNPSAMHHPDEKGMDGWMDGGTGDLRFLGVLQKRNSKRGFNSLKNLMDGGAIQGEPGYVEDSSSADFTMFLNISDWVHCSQELSVFSDEVHFHH